MIVEGLRKARHMVKEGIPKREVRKHLSTLKKKNIFSGSYEPLSKTDVSDILLSLYVCKYAKN